MHVCVRRTFRREADNKARRMPDKAGRGLSHHACMCAMRRRCKADNKAMKAPDKAGRGPAHHTAGQRQHPGQQLPL